MCETWLLQQWFLWVGVNPLRTYKALNHLGYLKGSCYIWINLSKSPLRLHNNQSCNFSESSQQHCPQCQGTRHPALQGEEGVLPEGPSVTSLMSSADFQERNDVVVYSLTQAALWSWSKIYDLAADHKPFGTWPQAGRPHMVQYSAWMYRHWIKPTRSITVQAVIANENPCWNLVFTKWQGAKLPPSHGPHIPPWSCRRLTSSTQNHWTQEGPEECTASSETRSPKNIGDLPYFITTVCSRNV